MIENQKILSIRDICHLIQRDRRTLWCWVKSNQFPDPIRMNGRTVGWPENVYQEWLIKMNSGQ